MRFPSGSPRWGHNWQADGHATAGQSQLPPRRARRRAGSDERKSLVACHLCDPSGQARWKRGRFNFVESVGGEPESMRRADIAIVAVDAGPASGLRSQQTANMTAECEVYAWTLSDKLPVIPIPLKPGDADASVPLQEVFDTVYQRAPYHLSDKYTACSIHRSPRMSCAGFNRHRVNRRQAAQNKVSFIPCRWESSSLCSRSRRRSTVAFPGLHGA